MQLINLGTMYYGRSGDTLSSIHARFLSPLSALRCELKNEWRERERELREREPERERERERLRSEPRSM